jgi:hypothetical protein
MLLLLYALKPKTQDQLSVIQDLHQNVLDELILLLLRSWPHLALPSPPWHRVPQAPELFLGPSLPMNLSPNTVSPKDLHHSKRLRLSMLH